MFSFHTRASSLIPVAAIKDSEKSEIHIDEAEDNTERPRRHAGQHVLVYLLFLADAIMQSSLSSQIDALLPTGSACWSRDSSFLRSILQCAYYFGASTGLVWGMAADRFGRRRVALSSLLASLLCCVLMGFATSFGAFALLRYVAGVVGSAAPVAGLAALADTTHGSSTQRTWVIARLPVVAVCGQIGPILSGTMKHFSRDRFQGVFVEYPALGGQATCGLLVFAIAIAECLFLEETLPTMIHSNGIREDECIDCEKAAFLGPSLPNGSHESSSLAISIIDALQDDDDDNDDDGPATPQPSYISLSQLLTAPSVLVLLVSFSALSVHSSTFDVLLPRLGHDAPHDIGLALPCTWLQPVMLAVKLIAASTMLFVPSLVSTTGLVPLYRRISVVFPALYVLLPVLALAARSCGDSAVIAGTFSTVAALVKTTLSSAAQVLVLLIALSTAPDASSTGTLIGVISISEMFKALAVGVAAVTYFLSDDYSMLAVNGALWSVLATVAAVGAITALRLRETARVGADLPEECLVWQGLFDIDSEDEAGF